MNEKRETKNGVEIICYDLKPKPNFITQFNMNPKEIYFFYWWERGYAIVENNSELTVAIWTIKPKP